MPKTRGRSPGFRMSEEHRLKIQNSNILNALIEHAEGRRDMSSTQVTAGLALLKKVMPDLSHTTIAGDEDAPLRTVSEMTDEALLRIAAASREGATSQAKGTGKPH